MLCDHFVFISHFLVYEQTFTRFKDECLLLLKKKRVIKSVKKNKSIVIEKQKQFKCRSIYFN